MDAREMDRLPEQFECRWREDCRGYLPLSAGIDGQGLTRADISPDTGVVENGYFGDYLTCARYRESGRRSVITARPTGTWRSTRSRRVRHGRKSAGRNDR